MKISFLYPGFAGLFLLTMFATSCRTDSGEPRMVEIKGEYICISLHQYFTELNQLISSGKPAPEELDSLFGMSWLSGYVIDSVKNDIILVGRCDKLRPAYHAEDMFVSYQNVFDSVSAPYCSLDPNPRNIMRVNEFLKNESVDFETTIKNCQAAIGGQEIVVGGVPRNSRYARTMIYADYDMKKISQGLLKVNGINSYLDLSMKDTVKKHGQAPNMSRFWLHIKESTEEEKFPNYLENEGIVFVNECPVVVLTEKQRISADGKLKDDTLREDTVARAFATGMSNAYPKLALQNQLFAELENMFRLQACFLAMKYKNALQVSKTDLSMVSGFHLVSGNEMPDSLPGLVNFKTTQRKTQQKDGSTIHQNLYLVMGGVSQEMTLTEMSLYYTKTIENPAEMILKSRPKPGSIYWKVIL
ncbi:MAG: DUF1598 domain-containing protein [Bacteroidota bacterium]